MQPGWFQCEATMYRKILIPLDGSPSAEEALPHLHALLAHVPATVQVHLLLVAPFMQDYSVTMVNLYPFFPARDAAAVARTDVERVEKDLRSYLGNLAERITAWGALTTWELRHGNPAEEILECAAEIGADLIVMSTRGRSGVNRWVFGSVADRVLRSAPIPILLIRAHRDVAAET
jgi:nucleotide-binding universal stress UspA family protein